jgi:hypothetical protein
MNFRTPIRRPWRMLALPVLAACVDRSPTLPPVEPLPVPAGAATLQCTVSVAERRMSCADAPADGPRAAKLLGGQDKYVKLASSGTAWNAVTKVLSSNVTVQNLLAQSIGTEDGTTVTGVDVFFAAQPSVTDGTGSVTVGNADGLGTFNGTNQPYFHYAEILESYEVSAARNWEFHVSGSVSTFTFTVYLSVTMADEDADLLDRVWAGTSSDWEAGANWSNGAAPDSASVVSIPADSLLAPGHAQPALSADARLTHLRVGYGSSLGLNGFTLTAWGNVDAVGALSGGTLWLRGGTGFLGGSVDALKVSGAASLQRSTTASGAVSVSDGTLTVTDRALTISAP